MRERMNEDKNERKENDRNNSKKASKHSKNSKRNKKKETKCSSKLQTTRQHSTKTNPSSAYAYIKPDCFEPRLTTRCGLCSKAPMIKSSHGSVAKQRVFQVFGLLDNRRYGQLSACECVKNTPENVTSTNKKKRKYSDAAQNCDMKIERERIASINNSPVFLRFVSMGCCSLFVRS